MLAILAISAGSIGNASMIARSRPPQPRLHPQNHVAILDLSNIEHLWNGAPSIVKTVKYMHPRHLHASFGILCNMQPHRTTAGTLSNSGCGSRGCPARNP